MSVSGKHLANTAVNFSLSRGPGRPKGLPKTGGRKPGTKNRRTVDAETFIQPLTRAAKRRLKEVLNGDDDELSLKAAMLILSYKFGRPTERRPLRAHHSMRARSSSADR